MSAIVQRAVQNVGNMCPELTGGAISIQVTESIALEFDTGSGRGGSGLECRKVDEANNAAGRSCLQLACHGDLLTRLINNHCL